MKSITFLVVSLMLSANSFSQDFWYAVDSVNGPGRSVAASFMCLKQGWVVSGLNDTGFKRKMYSYDPVQNDWDDEQPIGGVNGDGLERGSATGFSLLNKGYVCLGQGDFTPYSSDLWEYDPITEAWSQKSDFIGDPRTQAVGFTINDVAFVGTGLAASGLKKDFFKYDPTTNTWSQIADFGGTARRQATAFTIGADGYVGTGDDGILKNDFWNYNASANTWTQKASFPGTPRSGAVSWGTATYGVIGLGEDNTFAYKKDMWQYYFYSNTWVQRLDFVGSPRKNAIAFYIDGIAYVGTGYDGDFKDDLYAYVGIVGLNENKLEYTSTAFPNPVQGELTIDLGDISASEVDLKVFNIAGIEVGNKIDVQEQGNKKVVNVLSLSKGHYIYRLTTVNSNQFSTGKFVKL